MHKALLRRLSAEQLLSADIQTTINQFP